MTINGANLNIKSCITVRNLSIKYHGYWALKNINGAFKPSSMTAIIGPNGGGKSTFLKSLLQMIPIHSGKIDFQYLTRRDIAYIPQLSEIDREFPLIVEEAVAFGFCHQFGFFKSITSASQQNIDAILHEFGLYSLKHKTLDTLSGGQFQRVLFARLSVQQSRFILLDEPFAAVDSHTIDELMQMIVKWHQQGTSVIMVSHDLDLVQHYFNQTVLIAQECLGWGDTATVITDDNIRKAKKISRELHNNLPGQSAKFPSMNMQY